MDELEQNSFLFAANSVFIEELYAKYLKDPNAVGASWRMFFKKIQDKNSTPLTKTTVKVINAGISKEDTSSDSEIVISLKANNMIAAYRERGHYLAKLDPLELEVTKTKEELNLTLENFDFSYSQLDSEINIKNDNFFLKNCKLSTLVEFLDHTYAGNIGVEFAHLVNEEEKNWLYHRFEVANISIKLEEKKKVLNDLVEVEGFEQYLHTKFPGAKRFSIEGGETSIISLDKAIAVAVNHGVQEIIIGMAHRGRLTATSKVIEKPYSAVMASFISGNVFPDSLNVSGDVKYHLGYSSDRIFNGKSVHVSLISNPSHLEAVNSVVAGHVRAKQDVLADTDCKKVKAILVHGDAAFSGQGVVAESLSMTNLPAYNTGGILHIIVNNQLGFTANAADTHSGRYSTEFAKIIAAPILHVNGDDVEAVLRVTNIAMEYSCKFGKDAVVEIICYRKYGHNEGDEPMYTQPVMYNVIKHKKPVAVIYSDILMKEKIIDNSYYNNLKQQFKQKLDKEYKVANNYKQEFSAVGGIWQNLTHFGPSVVSTGVDKRILQDLGSKLCVVPKDFSINSKLTKLLEARSATLLNDRPIDWATAEQLAFASLLYEGNNIRITGQDCSRGTFSHRHSVLHCQKDDRKYLPLNNLSADQGKYEVADSNLSEYAVLGFEYGYSCVSPRGLVIWEAQFGDFANGAQIIFDQFIASGEAKWLCLSKLVVLLPHGFEGQGPEHSSARLERFLQLCAENNMCVVYPTTPASIFHLLRRQVLSSTTKPLIVMSPKSLLRNKFAVSMLSEIDAESNFIPILDEEHDSNNIDKVVICSGKVYYDLCEKRSAKNITNVAIIRLEQLYPLEKDILTSLLKKYSKAQQFVWCQEEPKNMGAWSYIMLYLNDMLRSIGSSAEIQYVGREESSSPAVGSLYVHNRQQEELVSKALEG